MNSHNLAEPEEYGTEGMELTPSASSNLNLLQYSEPSAAQLSKNKENGEDFFNYHYQQMMQQTEG